MNTAKEMVVFDPHFERECETTVYSGTLHGNPIRVAFDDYNNLVEVVDRKGVTMFNNYNIVAVREGNMIYGTFLKQGDLQLEGFDYELKRA